MDNYEKKYKETLEKAKEWEKKYILTNTISPDGIMAKEFKEIFPELTESEDERTRKAIIELLKEVGRDDTGISENAKRMIAYLEKQKEQKPVDDKAFEKWLDDWYQGSKELGGDVVMSESEFKNWSRGIRNMYAEQKPNIEICPHSIKSKSYKESGYPIEDCDYGLEIAENILEKTLGKVEGFQTDDGIREHQTAIKYVKDARKEQKPAEWSEKDEKTLASIIDYLDRSDLVNYDEFIEFEEFLQSLPMRCPKNSDNWKPSEMQLEALDNARHSGGSHYLLDSLYNDLKKL